MNQIAGVFSGHLNIQIELPPPSAEVMPGVAWGAVEAFPSPAYWVYQVLARRITCTTINHKLGGDLVEEVAACLLGGYGIPAEVGLAAFWRLRDTGALHAQASEAELLDLLSAPLDVGGRLVRYRFAAQKARFLAQALTMLAEEVAPTASGRALRDWLTRLPGVGLKTASWIARNLMEANDVAILDIHILRAGVLGGFFDPTLTVERHYLNLEAQFLEFSRYLQVKPSELDSVIWLEMKLSPKSVSRLLEGKQAREANGLKTLANRHPRSHKSSTNTKQPLLFK